MADMGSVSSPRRILSLSKKRRATVSYSDINDNTAGFGLSGKHGPKTSEAYGFVGSKTTIAATVVYLIWAYVPEPWLHAVGIHYYPSRYWALAVPAYLMVTVVLALGLYIGLNFMATPPPDSLYTVFDENSREAVLSAPPIEGEERAIDPIFDIGIDQINDLMFIGEKSYPDCSITPKNVIEKPLLI